MRERNELRLTTPTDPATLLDSSAKVRSDPNWWKNAASGFGHEYHTIASQRQGFDGVGSGLNHGPLQTGTDPNYRGIVPIDDTVKKNMGNSALQPLWSLRTPGEPMQPNRRKTGDRVVFCCFCNADNFRTHWRRITSCLNQQIRHQQQTAM